jgi:curved DNA-binding protein
MDYYSTLGINRNATADEIKKAYRSLAMKHHPDRGGDANKFKEIEEAYRTLSDPQKKQMFDMGVDPNQQSRGHGFHGQGPFEFHFNTGNFEDVFGNFGFGFGGRHMPRNKTISLGVELTLEDILHGKELDAEVSIPGGKKKIISISIPAGIEEGQQIRYQGMGDNSIPNAPPGDLIINIRVRQHPMFRREGDNLVVEKSISVTDAILGNNLSIRTLDGKDLEITIPPGSQSDTVLSCKNEGFPNVRNRQRGNLLIKLKVKIPRQLNKEQLKIVESLKQHGI